MRVVLFGGTADGRELAAQLAALGVRLEVCVATEYGREEMAGVAGCRVWAGRLDVQGMERLVTGADLCIDATHPYARQVTDNIRAACARAGTPLRRLYRQPGASGEDLSAARWADSPEQAAALLESTEGNILLATGAKELNAYRDLDPTRLYPRVLPVRESLAACEALGIPHRNIIAMQGPFSEELNVALIRQFAIRWMVTKDGGRAGGFEQKAAAAKKAGIDMIVIRRPGDGGDSPAMILQLCREMLTCR